MDRQEELHNWSRVEEATLVQGSQVSGQRRLPARSLITRLFLFLACALMWPSPYL